MLEAKNQLQFDETETVETIICQNCGEICDKYNATYFDKNWLCEECYNEQTFICSCCNKTYWVKNSYDDGNIILCENCYFNKYTTCCKCGHFVKKENTKNKVYCKNCSTKNKIEYIHDYSYKPKPIFYGKGIFYGIELEVEGEREENETARKLLEIANKKAEHLYCKMDSSLKYGFELVTYPMTLQYHMKEMPWKEILQKCLDMGYLSCYTHTCGLHIHVSRKELGKTLEEQDKVIARILFFLEKHWDKIVKFSRRTEKQINKWAARYGCKKNLKEMLKYAVNSNKRYVCLNLQNEETIEFRIFRGTLEYQSFMATIQLVDSICSVAIFMSDKIFECMTWNGFLKNIDFCFKVELFHYLKQIELLKTI